MQTISILLIDDDEAEAGRQQKLIHRAWSDVEITFLHPNDITSINEFIDFVDRVKFSIVIIDHRLGEHSRCNYTGLELAEALRNSFPMLPLFILTKFAQADELEEKGYSVDDVMDKTSMRKHPETYTGRMQRAANRYYEYLSDLNKRLQEIIVISLERELNEEEVTEMKNIRVKLLGHTLERVIEESSEAKAQLAQQRTDIEEIKRLLDKD